MDFIAVHFHAVFDFQQFAVNTNFREAIFLDLLEEFSVMSLAPSHDRRKYHDARSLLIPEQAINHLIQTLPLYRRSIVRTMLHSRAGKKQAQVVIDLRYCTDGRTRIPADSFLFDGDGRTKTIDVINIRTLHAPEKLPGVGGETFDIATLTFGVDGIEGEARLT